MQHTNFNIDLFDIVNPLLEGLEFKLVDVNSNINGEFIKIHLIVHSDNGVGINECAKIHKSLFERLELMYDEFDVSLEVSSPGINRAFKYYEEFEIFNGKKVKILAVNESEWMTGVILGVNEDSVTVKCDEEIKLSFDEIVKAKLV